MASASLGIWRSTCAGALDQIEAAHAALGGTGPGRRFATEQVNHAYAVLLSSQFQRFCRDLHAEASLHVAAAAGGPALRTLVQVQLVLNRQLDRGNPNPGNLGSDFGRFDLRLWDQLISHDRRNRQRQANLESLNRWRNAIAHQDFDPNRLGSTHLGLAAVRRWRRACNGLARDMDLVVGQHLVTILGTTSW